MTRCVSTRIMVVALSEVTRVREGTEQMRREGVYVMRVASRLSGMHPQTLRKYERVGLLAPTRIGALRMYSDEDIALLKMIKYLIGNLGLNVAGVELALRMRSGLKALTRQADALPEGSPSRKNMERTIEQMLRLIEAPEGR